jgi:serine/threonine protein kinase
MSYVPPETCRGETYTVKADIYSCGVCLWEMAYRLVKGQYQHPFSEFTDLQGIQLVMQVPNGLRPTVPPNCPPLMDSLIQKCWDNDQNNRPNSTELLDLLLECRKDLEQHPEIWKPSEHKPPLRAIEELKREEEEMKL